MLSNNTIYNLRKLDFKLKDFCLVFFTVSQIMNNILLQYLSYFWSMIKPNYLFNIYKIIIFDYSNLKIKKCSTILPFLRILFQNDTHRKGLYTSPTSSKLYKEGKGN